MRALKLGILSRNRLLYSTQRLIEAARRRRHVVHVVDPYGCILLTSDAGDTILYRGAPLQHFDAIIPRIGNSATHVGQALLQAFGDAMGIPLVNDAQGIVGSRDKFLSVQRLAQAGLPVPRTVMLRQPDQLADAIRAIGGFPIVLKIAQGTQGVGVMRADDIQTARAILEAFWAMRQHIVLQEYITESQGEDLRVIVVGGHAVAAMRRQADEDEFRANLHRGGKADSVELTAPLVELATRAAKVFNLGLAGVDLVVSERGLLLIEVNSSPGLEGIEAATGLDLARKIIVHAEHIATDHKHARSA